MANSSIILIASQGVAAVAAYLYASLGEAFGQRAGVFNLGVDGVMLMGAFTAFYAVFTGQSPLAVAADERLRPVAWGLAIIVGLGNGLGHIIASLWFRKMMPGTWSAPLLLIAGAVLLTASV